MAHFLKKLELNGFKSFAQKTVLEFPDGITAIVGPNGSGKSNVIDAIRWLLGEREARNLRGTTVEDLIFAGNHKRARLGQAQASLHFDNAEKFFPVEFPEVSILRQVSRDGVSRYFLNKAEVRLKDVVDFFARARLGTKGLVVVTQGNSDVFVQAPPATRQEMIEEILGLREYQLKKLDAERRLKNAEINLEKVGALLEEILPHLRSLRRQTNRWEKKEQYEGELRDSENQFFGCHFFALREEAARVEEEINRHREELEKLEGEKKKAEARLQEVEVNQPRERQDILLIKEETQKFLKKKSEIQKEIGRLEAQMEMAKSSPERHPAPLSSLLELLKKIRGILEESMNREVEEIREAIKNILREIDELTVESAAAPEGVPAALGTQFEKIQNDMKDVEGKLISLREREESLGEHREQFYEDFKSAVAQRENVKDRIEKWEAENQERRFRKERLELRRGELERQVTQAGRDPGEFFEYRPPRGLSPEELAAIEKQMFKRRGDIASIGEIDEALRKEARETEERYLFLDRELKDLEKARRDLGTLIRDLNEKIKSEFHEALDEINEEFNKFFHLMFGGGKARLKLIKRVLPLKTEGEDEGESGKTQESEPEEELYGGVDIDLSLPRKRINSLEMLSGGERSLVGIAALFALISVSPPPFLVLDEIDAALDDRNARRFAEMLKEFSKKIQFIIVTHNRVTMEAADVLYGVTMNEDGTSKILSLKLESA